MTTDLTNPNLNGYMAFFKGKTVEVYAESSYRAQMKAAQHFRARRPYDVSVVLCERADGSVVTHSTAAF